MTKRAERQDEKFIRDVSAIKNALQSIAKDLHYFRKKDEAAANPAPTCKDCIHYRQKMTAADNYIFHWCDYQDCCISEDGLNRPCSDFEEEKDAAK